MAGFAQKQENIVELAQKKRKFKEKLNYRLDSEGFHIYFVRGVIKDNVRYMIVVLDYNDKPYTFRVKFDKHRQLFTNRTRKELIQRLLKWRKDSLD
jgi:hypothetical protein